MEVSELMPDWVIAIIVLAIITVPLLIARLWWWVGLVALIAAYEGVTTLVSGYSLSQQFWALHAVDSILGWGILVIFGVAWVGLLIHLAWKQLKAMNAIHKFPKP